MFNIKFEKVYCQGVKGAYSHIACKELFKGIEPVFVRTFGDVCKNVHSGGAGVLPSENSTAGLVNGIIDLLLKYGLNIIHAKTIEINHHLCGLKGMETGGVKRIYSHQQALLQCSEYLNTIDAEQIETVNTASSAKMAAAQNGAAAVCSREAAEIYGLAVLKENICNNKSNSTRFIVVSNKALNSLNANTVSVYFKLKNKSGALYKALKIFADYNINLSSIHSLPLENETWHYGFFADIEGNINEANLINCIKEFKTEAEYLNVLGSYISE